jgi:hypothetical protein
VAPFMKCRERKLRRGPIHVPEHHLPATVVRRSPSEHNFPRARTFRRSRHKQVGGLGVLPVGDRKHPMPLERDAREAGSRIRQSINEVVPAESPEGRKKHKLGGQGRDTPRAQHIDCKCSQLSADAPIGVTSA